MARRARVIAGWAQRQDGRGRAGERMEPETMISAWAVAPGPSRTGSHLGGSILVWPARAVSRR